MAFIRVKRVKQWKYAYLVENSWKGKRTKQKVKDYLGKVHKLQGVEGDIDEDISDMKYDEAVKILLKHQLISNGFCLNEECGSFVKDDIKINFDAGEFKIKEKPAVFECNEGFICKHTFDNVMNFKSNGDEEETAVKLAEAILGAGIKVPNSVFVQLFEKIHDSSMPIIETHEEMIAQQSKKDKKLMSKIVEDIEKNGDDNE